MSSIMDFDRIEKRAKRNTIIRNIVVYGLLAVWALVVLFPFYWMLLTSVKTQGSYASEIVPKLFTLSPTAENYMAVFTEADLGRYFFNTIVFTVLMGIMGILSWSDWYSIFVFLGLVINSYCMSFKDPQNIRKSILVTSPLVLSLSNHLYLFS